MGRMQCPKYTLRYRYRQFGKKIILSYRQLKQITSQGPFGHSENEVPFKCLIMSRKRRSYLTFSKQQAFVLSIWVKWHNESGTMLPSQCHHCFIYMPVTVSCRRPERTLQISAHLRQEEYLKRPDHEVSLHTDRCIVRCEKAADEEDQTTNQHRLHHCQPLRRHHQVDRTWCK